LQKAAARGKTLGILIRSGNASLQLSSVDLRLKFEMDAAGSVVSLLNNQGETVSAVVLD